nr:E3 ubiquitin protein ligase DRIP1-like [Ziziphus jujuba var. spinosa]
MQMRNSKIPMMSNNLVKLKKRPFLDCLACPLCKNLLKDPTTVSVCLHTFCKHCIYQKLEEDVRNCCPVCNTYLGFFPEQLLRPDHNLRDLTVQILPVDNYIRRHDALVTSQGNTTGPINNTRQNTQGEKEFVQDSRAHEIAPPMMKIKQITNNVSKYFSDWKKNDGRIETSMTRHYSDNTGRSRATVLDKPQCPIWFCLLACDNKT